MYMHVCVALHVHVVVRFDSSGAKKRMYFSFDLTLNTAVLRFNEHIALYFNAAHKVFLKKFMTTHRNIYFGRMHVHFLNRNFLGVN